MIAGVVPIRALPSARVMFDYDIPPDLKVQPGQLVRIPFLRSLTQGVVWDIRARSDAPRRRPIASVVSPTPVVTDWQRRVFQAIRDQTFVSYGSLLRSSLPSWTTRQPPPLLAQAFPTESTQPTNALLWYRDRSEAVKRLRSWWHNTTGFRLILEPTIEDGHRLATVLGVRSPIVSGELSAVQYRQLYQQVLSGQVQAVIGTAAALGLPFPVPPLVALDQEEHPGYKLQLRHPRFDARAVLDRLQRLDIVLTSSPTVGYYHRHHPSPPLPRGNRLVTRLDQPHPQPWLTSEVVDLIDQAISNKHRSLIITPHRGFGRLIRCEDCGLVPLCPVCQHLTVLQPTDRRLRCPHCGQVTAVPTSCSRCRGTSWRVVGLGVRQLLEHLPSQWLTAAIGEQQRRDQVLISDYRAWQTLPEPTGIQIIVLVQADALLSFPDFTSEERAWHFLARLAAWAPTTAIVAQTFQAESAFWQRWRRGDDRTWYAYELEQRQKLRLPPYGDHWLIRYAGSSVNPVWPQLIDRVKRLAPDLNLTTISGRRERGPGAQRLLISSADRPIAEQLDALELFPTPWQVETVVDNWIN